LALAGLGAACRELLADHDELVFLKARGATGQLGLRVQGFDDDRNRRYLEHHRDDAKVAGIGDMSVEQAVRAIEAAVQQAFDECRVADELIDLGVPYPPDEFGFSSLQEHFSQQRRPYR
jgi:20S proteasome alpha/beta subunit